MLPSPIPLLCHHILTYSLRWPGDTDDLHLSLTTQVAHHPQLLYATHHTILMTSRHHTVCQIHQTVI